MKIKLLVAMLSCGLLASNSSIAYQNKLPGSGLHWWSDNPTHLVTAMPPPEDQPQWYIRIKVYENCGNVPCGEIRINNCLMLSTLSAGQQGICQFADPTKPVTWYAIGFNESAGENEYIQL
jgi:hypothetical protein